MNVRKRADRQSIQHFAARTRALLFLILLGCFSFPPTTNGQDGGEIVFTEERLASVADFIVTIRIADMPHYKVNQIREKNPALKAVISYRLYPKPRKVRDLNEHLYEELYYDGKLPLGSHHFGPLNLLTGEVGVIRLVGSDELDQNPCTAADAAVHIYLDLCLSNNKLGMFLVPKGNWESVTDCLPDLKFFDPSKQRSLGGMNKSMYLYVVSDPKSSKTEKTYFYKRL